MWEVGKAFGLEGFRNKREYEGWDWCGRARVRIAQLLSKKGKRDDGGSGDGSGVRREGGKGEG